MPILDAIIKSKSKGLKQFGILIDPDKTNERDDLRRITEQAMYARADVLLVGSSLMCGDGFDKTVRLIKELSDIPVLLFPGNQYQISAQADAILLLSLISGRNPELLIGKQVEAAPKLRQSGLEVIPTGYMLVDGGRPTSVSWASQTIPIPADKPDIAVATAMAGEMLGLRLLYLDAGSGAKHTVRPEMLRAIGNEVKLPLVVGGGIKEPRQVLDLCRAGADLIVVGNALETDPERAIELGHAIHSENLIARS